MIITSRSRNKATEENIEVQIPPPELQNSPGNICDLTDPWDWDFNQLTNNP